MAVVNRRSFIKRTIFLLCMPLVSPREFVSVVTTLRKSPRNWRETILHLYPSGEAPFIKFLRSSTHATHDVEHRWWEDNLDQHT